MKLNRRAALLALLGLAAAVALPAHGQEPRRIFIPVLTRPEGWCLGASLLGVDSRLA